MIKAYFRLFVSVSSSFVKKRRLKEHDSEYIARRYLLKDFTMHFQASKRPHRLTLSWSLIYGAEYLTNSASARNGARTSRPGPQFTGFTDS